MSKAPQLLEFVIRDAFSPDTLPMWRLAEYLTDLALVLGEKDHVHFVEIKSGSACLVHAIDHEAAPKTQERVRAVQYGDEDAEPEAVHAFQRIDQRLRADNAHAVLRPKDDESGRLLVFPGITAQGDEVYGPFKEEGHLYGVPISVGGKKSLVNVNLEDGGKTHFCEADRDIALQIAPLMFHHRIRASGTGRYLRDSQGQWLLKAFRISSFERLEERSLSETVDRLRDITKKVKLSKDITSKVATLREA